MSAAAAPSAAASPAGAAAGVAAASPVPAAAVANAATPLPEPERLALLERAKARRAALAAQYARLPLCLAGDTPSGLKRREALGRAMDQAERDVDALERAAQVVVVVVSGTAAKETATTATTAASAKRRSGGGR